MKKKLNIADFWWLQTQPIEEIKRFGFPVIEYHSSRETMYSELKFKPRKTEPVPPPVTPPREDDVIVFEVGKVYKIMFKMPEGE